MTATKRREAANLSWEDLRDLAEEGAAALLPVGSTEAHGPHLPLDTDVVIATEVARRAQDILTEEGVPSVIFPPLAYGVTEFARGFSGTVTISASTLKSMIVDLARSLFEQGFGPLVLVNHHLEPAHFDALHEAAKLAEPAKVLVPDHRRRPWAIELGEEFCRGGSHAGQYETSLVLASAPEKVFEERRALPRLDVNLGKRIREGASTFEEMGGTRAYFGDPAAATAMEGNRLFRVLARQVADSILQASRE